MADEAETLYAFNKADSTSLLRMVKSDASVGSNLNAMTFDASAAYFAVTTSAITAKSGSTCGTGTAMLQSINASRVVSNWEEVDVINVSTTAIQTGKAVKLFRIGMHLSAVEIC